MLMARSVARSGRVGNEKGFTAATESNQGMMPTADYEEHDTGSRDTCAR